MLWQGVISVVLTIEFVDPGGMWSLIPEGPGLRVELPPELRQERLLLVTSKGPAESSRVPEIKRLKPQLIESCASSTSTC